MGNKPVTSKQQLLNAAFAIAEETGLSGLSIRKVAQACDVAVGTVYNFYPTKSDLVNDVVAKFWREAMANRLPSAAAQGDFMGFCAELAQEVSGALEQFRSGWLAEVSALDAQDLASAHAREEACFAHVREALGMALAADNTVERERLQGPLAPEALCRFVWDSMLASLRQGDTGCETLFALLKHALYT